jgi:predicted  nucleic acid-binding Zn-ribbon protein
MATIPQRVKKLEAKVAKLEKRLKKAETELKAHKTKIKALETWKGKINVWGKQQADWTGEVTAMLRAVNWAAVVSTFPGGGGTNPPQEPPDWPGG